jgi:hypothetical protein
VKHLHHIVPKHAGGTDDFSNLVELTVEEHTEAHRVLWEQYGRWQDKLAYDCLRGHIVSGEAIKTAQRMFHTPEIRAQWSKRMKENRANGKCVNKPDQNAKVYKIVAPDGTMSTIRNLSKWAKETGLNEGSVRRVANGHRTSIFGYRIEPV